MSWSVVVPTNRPDRYIKFFESWQPLFSKHNVRLIVCHDSDTYDIKSSAENVEVHNWHDIPDFIPRKTDMIRSWGIYRAWKAGSTYTLSLDDDVLPEGDLFEEYERVFERGAPCSDYLSVGALTSWDGELRGFPYADRVASEVVVQYGGWDGVLDYDAPTQLVGVPDSARFLPVVLPVPRGAAVTGCIMNCAWRTEYAPIMWQLPLYQGRFNRFGDIWSCLFQKRVLDALGKVMVINGKASVRHDRASDPLANLEREAPGIPVNEQMWDATNFVKGPGPLSHPLINVYRAATEHTVGTYFRKKDFQYAAHFKDARDEWLALFS